MAFAVAALQMRPLLSAMQSVVPHASQSTLPHAQADGLGAEPSVMAQTGPLRHLFWDR